MAESLDRWSNTAKASSSNTLQSKSMKSKFRSMPDSPLKPAAILWFRCSHCFSSRLFYFVYFKYLQYLLLSFIYFEMNCECDHQQMALSSYTYLCNGKVNITHATISYFTQTISTQWVIHHIYDTLFNILNCVGQYIDYTIWAIRVIISITWVIIARARAKKTTWSARIFPIKGSINSIFYQSINTKKKQNKILNSLRRIQSTYYNIYIYASYRIAVTRQPA